MSRALRTFYDLIIYAPLNSYENEYRINRCREEGKEIPDNLKPGYMVLKQKPEVREALQELTSDEVSNMRLYS